MINYNDIKIFNKHGNEIPLFFTSNLIFTTAVNLESITDDDVVLYGYYDNENKNLFPIKIIQSGKLSSKEIIKYTDTYKLLLNCFFDNELINTQAYIYIDLSKDDSGEYINLNKLYSTNYNNTSINLYSTIANDKDDDNYFYYSLLPTENKVYCDLSNINDILFPSTVFIGKIEIDRVSTGLVETETLIFGKTKNNELIDLNYDDNYEIELILDSDDEYIRFLTHNENENIIIKSDKFILNNYPNNYVNIGFFPDKEGVYEQTIFVCLRNKENNNVHKIGEIIVISEAIGEDERYRALFDNFGILNPSTYYSIFKDHDINEENINWELINKKSKELFLTYDQIFPYIGTYKALINAVNYLGYDDIYFREWYKIIDKTNKEKNISYRIDLNNIFNDKDLHNDNSISIYKKINKLSMIYKINQESEKFDEYDIPIIENVYNYSITEVLTKLIMLKEWLERNIIAVNCKILDITGEGVIYEKQNYISYGTIMQNIEHEDILEINPKLEKRIIELIDGSANINVSNIISSVDNYIQLSDFGNSSISDFSENAQTFKYPFMHNSIVKGYVDTSNAIIRDNVTKPLWINNGELSFLINKDVSTFSVKSENNDILYSLDSSNTVIGVSSENFIDTSEFIHAPIIQLQKGYIRYDRLDWNDNIKYSILPANNEYSYKIVNKSGNTEYSHDNIILYPMDGATLKYTYNNSYNVPLFKIKNYKIVLYNNKNNMYTNSSISDDMFIIDDECILDIQDGKILNTTNKNNKCIINFNYDFYNNGEQNVSVIYEYVSEHEYKPSKLNNNHYDEYFTLNVNNIGHYNILMYSFNNNGNIFVKEIDGGCDVIVNKADIDIYSDQMEHINNKSFYYKNSIGKEVNIDNILIEQPKSVSNDFPIFRESFKLGELSYGENNGKKYIQYPNISYSLDTAKNGDYLQLQNVIDKFEYISNDNFKLTFGLIGNKTFNSFPSMIENVNYVNLIIYDKKYNKAIFETEAKLDKIYYNLDRLMIDAYIYDGINMTNDDEINTEIEYIDFISYINNLKNDYNYEIYIQPITTYSLKSAEILENKKTKLILNDKFIKDDYDNDIVFNVGDCIKLIYSITKYQNSNMFIRQTDLTSTNPQIYESELINENGEEYYEIKNGNNIIRIEYNAASNEFYAIENNEYIKYYKLYSNTDNNNTYNGYATYRVQEITNEYIIINDIFNYQIYDVFNVLGKVKNGDVIDDSLKSNIKDYYIIRYLDSFGNMMPLTMKDYTIIKIGNKTYSINPIIVSLNISKAHQAYVNYTLIADYSEEFFNSYNRIYTDNNRLYSYLDNSFSLMINKFNQNDAYNLWNYDYIQPEKLYLHNNPITINRTERLKLNKYDTPQIVLSSKLKNQKDNNTYWKVYINQQKNRKLLFEVMNNKLVLDLKYLGVYDIEAYNYDEYGNLSITERNSFINVI